MSAGIGLPIWRDCNRLLLEIEQSVRGFPRYHKYTVGADMRRQAMVICRLLVRALDAERDKKLYQVRQMRLAIDDLKVMIQLAKEIKAFMNFQQFQVVSELVVTIGKQGGAWCRQLTQRIARPESEVGV
ncbi:MAG: four helix bundle protein [Desulfocapsaceae bacterium]|nr:four helix bundle protein [Desulfocapsaceae bacterium]